MLKRALVLLDETPSSVACRPYAFGLARSMGTQLAGLAGVDLASIEAPMMGRIGASAYKVTLEQQLTRQAAERRERLHASFEAECQRHHVPFEWLSFEGDPIEALLLATETRDLVVTGHDTAFQGDAHEALSETIAKLLTISPRPVVVCPDVPASGDEVLVAYDGSVPSMCALQMFALLGLGQDKTIHVISVNESQEIAARRAAGAATYLQSHGYQVDAAPIASRVHPAEVVRIETADRRTGTIVMGSYGHSGLGDFLFGSTTVSLVENPPCALFLYH